MFYIFLLHDYIIFALMVFLVTMLVVTTLNSLTPLIAVSTGIILIIPGELHFFIQSCMQDYLCHYLYCMLRAYYG